MSSKGKGTRAERELFHKLWEASWVCLRVAGSGSTTLPACDLIAGRSGRVLAIECKSGSNSRYLKKEAIDELVKFAHDFGAEPWLAARFDRKGWFFLPAGELRSTGANLVVSLKDMQERGLPFEKVIEKAEESSEVM